MGPPPLTNNADMEPPPLPPSPQNCARCDSSNTKFCYYNNYNYSLSQPRYFCKSCRRYWTHGGTLRNVPVGGGCRKAKRPKPSTSSNPLCSSVSFAPHPNMVPMGSYNNNFYGGAIMSSSAGTEQFDANMALLQSLRSHDRQFFVNMDPAMPPPMGSWTTQSFIRDSHGPSAGPWDRAGDGDRNLAGLNSFEPNRAGYGPSR